MTQIYEGMFLIDNAVVREGWDTAKTIVTGVLEKHGATMLSARRWDERRLSYPIKGKNRATFLLCYYNIPAEEIPAMRRDFELNESVMRSLELAVDAIPESEAEFVTVEASEEFNVPTPPDDDHIDFVEEPEDEYGDRRRRDDRDDRGSRDKDAGSEEKSDSKESADTTAESTKEGAESPKEGAESTKEGAESPKDGSESPKESTETVATTEEK